MAEVIGVAASAITVGGLAGNLAANVLALKRLWNEIRDVPETIENLIQNLELLHPVLSEMELEFLRLRGMFLNNSAAKLSMKYCRQAMKDLEALVEDIQTHLASRRRLKRNIVKLKVSIKKESMTRYQKRLQYALQILSLSQQTYLMALVRQSCLGTAEPSSVTDESTYHPKQHDKSPTVPCSKLPSNGAVPCSKPLPWRPGSHIGSFSGQIFEKATGNSTDPQCTSFQVYQARVQLPTWLAQKAWDFLIGKPSGVRNISICVWNIREHESEVFHCAYYGSSSDILSLIKSGQATLYDRDPDGMTLLHYAALKGHLETFRCLMNLGLKSTEHDVFGFTPLAYLYRATKDYGTAIDLIRFLIRQDELDDIIRSIFSPNFRALRETSLHRMIWAVPDLLTVVVEALEADFVHMQPNAKFASLIWEYVNPELLLSVLRRDGVTDATIFRAQLHDSVESSLHTFARMYFSMSPSVRRDGPRFEEEPGHEEKFNHWRALAQWLFSEISLREISKQGGASWESLTPLLTGLTGCDWTVPTSTRERRFVLQRLSRTTKMWLQDLSVSGFDLSEYGREEFELYTFDNWNRTWRWSILGLGETPYPSGPQLVSFSYGPRPEDWDFEWDLAVEEYIGDFWEVIENPPLHIPGEWVDDYQ